MKLTLIPDTMILSSKKGLVTDLVKLQRAKYIDLGSHEGIGTECWTTAKPTVSRKIIENLPQTINIWFQNPPEAIQQIHTALLHGLPIQSLRFGPVEGLAEMLRMKLALAIAPDEMSLKLRELRGLAKNIDRNQIRADISRSKTIASAELLENGVEHAVHRCLDPKDPWFGFALDTLLRENKVQVYTPGPPNRFQAKCMRRVVSQLF